MKIIYLAQVRLPSRKAHSVQIMNMCSAFANAGTEVRLVVPRWRPTEAGETFDYYGVVRNFSIVRIPMPRLAQFGAIGFLMETLIFSLLTTGYSIFGGSDTIYSRGLLPLVLANIFTRKRLVWETHTKVQGLLLTLMVKLIRGGRVLAVTITEALKSDLISHGIRGGHILVSPDGVNLDQFANLPDQILLRQELGLPLDKTIVAYVGRLRTMGQEKGVGELIEAYSTVEQKHKDTLLMLVGIHDGERLEVEELMKDYLVKNYIINPVVPSSMVPRYLSAADILVMNYPSSDHYAHFMSPLKMFEYMASGRVVVSTDLPSIREVLDDSRAVLVAPDNNDALAQGISSVMTDKDRADKLASQALLDVQRYSWDKRARSILNWL